MGLISTVCCNCKDFTDLWCNDDSSAACSPECCGKEEAFDCVWRSNHATARKYATKVAFEALNWVPTGGVTYGSFRLWQWLLNSTNGNVTPGNWAVYGGAGLVSGIAFCAIATSLTYSCSRWTRGVCWDNEKNAYDKV